MTTLSFNFLRRELTAILMILCASIVLATNAAAESRQDLLEMKNTVLNLVDALVEQGILREEQATNLKDKAKAQAAVDARQELIDEKERTNAEVRVQYVPEFYSRRN